MEDLKVSFIQTHLIWENIDANLNHFSSKIDAIKESTDLIVLPEMFTTGFAVDRTNIAEEHKGKSFNWMQKKAAEKNCVIAGSIAVKENGKLYNRFYWVKPDGSHEQYDKRHLFRMAGEEKFFTPGATQKIVELKGWKICLLICYDLRFPVWSRNKRQKDGSPAYDALIYVANWPEVRSYPWKQLLIARAIENQAYVVGVNRIGKDGNDYPHSGDSAVINPRGEVLTADLSHKDITIHTSLSKQYLKEFREIFPAVLDSDSYEFT